MGPWGSFNFGPLVYLSLYILCHVMLHESLGFVTKGGLGVLPQKKNLRILENGAIFGSTKWIEIACSTGIYIGIDKCSGPPISPGPGEIPPPPPLSVGLTSLSRCHTLCLAVASSIPCLF